METGVFSFIHEKLKLFLCLKLVSTAVALPQLAQTEQKTTHVEGVGRA